MTNDQDNSQGKTLTRVLIASDTLEATNFLYPVRGHSNVQNDRIAVPSTRTG